VGRKGHMLSRSSLEWTPPCHGGERGFESRRERTWTSDHGVSLEVSRWPLSSGVFPWEPRQFQGLCVFVV
jgi:hypothetical protein